MYEHFEITPRTYAVCNTKMFCIRWKISCAWPSSSLPSMSDNEERWHYGLYVLYSSDSVTVGTAAELKLSGLKKLGRGAGYLRSERALQFCSYYTYHILI